jgi:hypothetical protein
LIQSEEVSRRGVKKSLPAVKKTQAFLIDHLSFMLKAELLRGSDGKLTLIGAKTVCNRLIMLRCNLNCHFVMRIYDS